jgi:hypothetical protein
MYRVTYLAHDVPDLVLHALAQGKVVHRKQDPSSGEDAEDDPQHCNTT